MMTNCISWRALIWIETMILVMPFRNPPIGFASSSCGCAAMAAMQFSAFLAFLALQAQYAITPAQTGLLLSTVGMVGLVFGVTVNLFAPTIGYRRLFGRAGSGRDAGCCNP